MDDYPAFQIRAERVREFLTGRGDILPPRPKVAPEAYAEKWRYYAYGAVQGEPPAGGFKFETSSGIASTCRHEFCFRDGVLVFWIGHVDEWMDGGAKLVRQFVLFLEDDPPEGHRPTIFP